MSEILLDGSPDLTLLGALAYSPTQDSVSQVSIRPFDTDASFGHTIGGVINQVTKSEPMLSTVPRTGSTNSNPECESVLQWLHEPANQDAHLPLQPVWFDLWRTGVDSARLQKQGQAVFFFAYEGLKDSTPASTFTTVPTQAERNGDFSQLLAAGCTNGYTGQIRRAAICNGTGAANLSAL